MLLHINIFIICYDVTASLYNSTSDYFTNETNDRKSLDPGIRSSSLNFMLLLATANRLSAISATVIHLRWWEVYGDILEMLRFFWTFRPEPASNINLLSSLCSQKSYYPFPWDGRRGKGTTVLFKMWKVSSDRHLTCIQLAIWLRCHRWAVCRLSFTRGRLHDSVTINNVVSLPKSRPN